MFHLRFRREGKIRFLSACADASCGGGNGPGEEKERIQKKGHITYVGGGHQRAINF